MQMSSSPPPRSARCHALIPSAGNGSRLPGDAPKQYRRLLGEAVVQHTVRAFLQTSHIASVAVVVQADDTMAASCLAADARLSILPLGGASRAHSVLGGLDGLLQAGAVADDWVLVHDAARCCITPELIDRLIDACVNDATGGLLALPLPDTLKAADAAGRVARTEPREGRWLAQTPQMFRLGALRDALQAALSGDAAITDEASAIEHAGAHPLLVTGASWNFKITYPQDLELAQALLAARAGAKA